MQVIGEIVRTFDGKYYTHLRIGETLFLKLPEYVDYRTLRRAATAQYNIKLPPMKALRFYRFGRKKYASLAMEVQGNENRRRDTRIPDFINRNNIRANK